MVLMTNEERAVFVYNFLLSKNLVKFPKSYVDKVCASSSSSNKLSHEDYYQRCLIPDTVPPSYCAVIDKVCDLQQLADDIAETGLVLSLDTESCSSNDKFQDWPAHLRTRYRFQPVKQAEKGPFIVILSATYVTTKGQIRTYLIDVRKTGINPMLAVLNSPRIPKLIWDHDSERKSFGNTFGYTLSSSFVDVQRWARTSEVNCGLKTGLSSYVGLFRLLDITGEKSTFRGFNWNGDSWDTTDTKEALKYAACDSLFNLSVASGLAATLPYIKPQYRVVAAVLRVTTLRR